LYGGGFIPRRKKKRGDFELWAWVICLKV
jgi:hypothetical protein